MSRRRCTKPVKCDPALLQLARATFIEKLASRLEPVLTDFGEFKSVSGFKDPEFIRQFGPGLERMSEAQLVNQALMLLTRQVATAPPGKTGIPLFDDLQSQA